VEIFAGRKDLGIFKFKGNRPRESMRSVRSMRLTRGGSQRLAERVGFGGRPGRFARGVNKREAVPPVGARSAADFNRSTRLRQPWVTLKIPPDRANWLARPTPWSLPMTKLPLEGQKGLENRL
jgi:hypothetical protein